MRTRSHEAAPTMRTGEPKGLADMKELHRAGRQVDQTLDATNAQSRSAEAKRSKPKAAARCGGLASRTLGAWVRE